jgi:hypothetical protein
MYYITFCKTIPKYLLPANCVIFFYIGGKGTEMGDILELLMIAKLSDVS